MLFRALLRDCSAEDTRFDSDEGSRGETEEAAEVQLHPAEHVQVNHEVFLNNNHYSCSCFLNFPRCLDNQGIVRITVKILQYYLFRQWTRTWISG